MKKQQQQYHNNTWKRKIFDVMRTMIKQNIWKIWIFALNCKSFEWLRDRRKTAHYLNSLNFIYLFISFIYFLFNLSQFPRLLFSTCFDGTHGKPFRNSAYCIFSEWIIFNIKCQVKISLLKKYSTYVNVATYNCASASFISIYIYLNYMSSKKTKQNQIVINE